MGSVSTIISDVAAIAIAALYTAAGQAHFTDRFTPSLARDIETMTRNSQHAMNFLDINYVTFKRLLGTFDLVAAACLWRATTRKTGLVLAVVGFSGGLYGQIVTGQSILQVAALLATAVIGLTVRPARA